MSFGSRRVIAVGVLSLAFLGVWPSKAHAQIALSTDKATYAPDETITLNVARAQGVREPLLWMVRDGGPIVDNGFVRIDFGDFFRSGSATFPAPSVEGSWRLELHDLNGKVSIDESTRLVFVTFSVQPAPPVVATAPAPSPSASAPAAAPAPNYGSTSSRSARGYMSTASARQVVLGQRFTLTLSLPHFPPDEPSPGNIWLQWAFAADHQGRRDSSPPSPPRIAAGQPNQELVAYAPYWTPGSYQLQLVNDAGVMDSLPMQVIVGQEGLSGVKRTYRPGERIDYVVTLSPNRYYYGHWTGPSVVIYPIAVPVGRQIGPTEALTWFHGEGGAHRCGESIAHCANALGFLVLKPSVMNVHDGGKGVFAPGELDAEPMVLASVDPATGQSRFDRHLSAPNEPGEYEVRFYDRGTPNTPFADYVDYYLARARFTVEAASTSPVALRVFERRGDAFAEVDAVTHDVPFYVEATFEQLPGQTQPPTRTVTAEWVDDGRVQSFMVTLKHIGNGLYRSDPVTPRAPMLRRGGR